MSGYICIRSNEYFDEYDIYLIKFVENIKEFDITMREIEPIWGKYKKVFEIPLNKVEILYRLFTYNFQNFHYYKEGGGIYFYKKDALRFITSFLNKLKINYKELSNDEIEKLII